MKTGIILMLAAALLAPSAALAQEEEEGDDEAVSEAPASGTQAEANEEAPAAAPAPARAARKAYTVPIKRSASNYTTEQASPARTTEEDESGEETEARPAPVPRETRRAIAAPAVVPVAQPSGGGGGSCPPVPQKVRTYRLAGSEPDISFYCKDGDCASSIQLKHARYPSVVKVGELVDFAERCDFRNDTPCAVPGGYQDKAGLNTTSVYTESPVGGDPSAGGYAQTLVPIAGLAPRYAAFDLSIPFEIDPKMAGRTFLADYTINTNNPAGLQVSVSACEGDFSRQAILLKEGDFLNYLILASAGLEGNARSRGDTTRNLMALKAGKRYYLNVRRVSKGGLEDASDSLPDGAIHPYALARQMSRNHLLSQEFYRFGLHAYPAGNTMALKESEFAAKPGFRRPGQGL